MIKRLTKHGTSHALVIEKPVMESLGIGPNSPLQVTVSGDCLVISPVDVGVDPERLKERTRQIRSRYSSALKRLAE